MGPWGDGGSAARVAPPDSCRPGVEVQCPEHWLSWAAGIFGVFLLRMVGSGELAAAGAGVDRGILYSWASAVGSCHGGQDGMESQYRGLLRLLIGPGKILIFYQAFPPSFCICDGGSAAIFRDRLLSNFCSIAE